MVCIFALVGGMDSCEWGGRRGRGGGGMGGREGGRERENGTSKLVKEMLHT